MFRRTAVLGAIALAIALAASPAAAQEDAAVEDVEAKFGGTTIADWGDYRAAPECVTAAAVGAPAELGAMGFHAANPDLVDTEVDPLQPEVLVLDSEDDVIAVEYLVPTRDVERPSVFGQEFDEAEPNPAVDQPHYSLHLWLMDNPSGQFSAFNPNASCPETAGSEGGAPDEMPATGVGPGTLGLAALGFGGVGVGAVLVTASRRRSRVA